MKTRMLGRSLRLAKTALRVGLKEVGTPNLKTRIEQARLIADSLSQLKGAAMKAGQLLSMEVGDYFPPEAQEILSQLQGSAKSVPFDEIQKILNRELGPVKLSRLSEISKEPVAAASMGQVHVTHFGQKKLALKVQYDGVGESVASDLKILKGLSETLRTALGRKMDMNSFYDEIQRVLEQEADYRAELQFLLRYRTQVETLNKVSPYQFLVPEVFEELSTQKVLAMSWLEGVSLRTWLQSKPSLESRRWLAHSFLTLYGHEFFDWGLVQTDPNYANFLVGGEPSRPTVGLLDFGATCEYSEEFRRGYISLIRAAGEGSSQRILDRAAEFGVFDLRESAESQDLFIKLFELAVEPFFKGSFDFADARYVQRSQAVGRDFILSLKYTPPPYQLIFLHRKIAGLFSIFKRLEVRLDMKPYWEQMIQWPRPPISDFRRG